MIGRNQAHTEYIQYIRVRIPIRSYVLGSFQLSNRKMSGCRFPFPAMPAAADAMHACCKVRQLRRHMTHRPLLEGVGSLGSSRVVCPRERKEKKNQRRRRRRRLPDPRANNSRPPRGVIKHRACSECGSRSHSTPSLGLASTSREPILTSAGSIPQIRDAFISLARWTRKIAHQKVDTVQSTKYLIDTPTRRSQRDASPAPAFKGSLAHVCVVDGGVGVLETVGDLLVLLASLCCLLFFLLFRVFPYRL